MPINNNTLDIDPQETNDWIESISDLIDEKGLERTHFIIEKLIDYSRRNGIKLPFSANTEYVNTISLDYQKPYPGDRSIERRIKFLILGKSWKRDLSIALCFRSTWGDSWVESSRLISQKIIF